MKQQRFARSAAINLFSRLCMISLGFLQVIFVAKYFGLSEITDAYIVSTWIVFIVWSVGDTVLTYSLVPYLVSMDVKDGERGAKEAARRIFFWFAAALLVFSVSVYLFSPFLAYVLAPGFSPEARGLATGFLRLLSPAIFLGGIAAFFSAILYSVKKFALPALAALLPDICAIAFLVLGAGAFGIKALMLGLIAGAALQSALLALLLAKLKLFPGLRFSGLAALKETASLIGPRLGGVGINRTIVGIDRLFASMLGSGAISALAYSFKLTQMPVMLVVDALGKTLMPSLSRDAASGDTDKIRKLVPKVVGLVVFGLLPVVFLTIYYSEPIIRLLYQRGSFTPEDTAFASGVLVYYSLATIFTAISVVMAGIFFALGDTVTPLRVTVVSLFLNIALDYVLMNLFGIIGIPLATICVAMTSSVLLFNKLKAKLGHIDLLSGMGSFIKMALATAFMGATIWVLAKLTEYTSFSDYKVLEMAVFSVLSWASFIFACRLLRVEEYKSMRLMLGRRQAAANEG